MEAPTLYLVLAGTHYESRALASPDLRALPSVLLSFAYAKGFFAQKKKTGYRYRSMIVDSGAYTVHNTGGAIDLDEYCDFVTRIKEEERAEGRVLDGYFALDVIGDWKGSVENWERTMAKGFTDVIPVYHLGEPKEVLHEYARLSDKVGIGGFTILNGSQKTAYAHAVFKELWPKKLHGLGLGTERGMLATPWHSVDASSWALGPLKFGRYKSIGEYTGGRREKDLVPEIDYYMKIERKARHKWAREMARICRREEGDAAV